MALQILFFAPANLLSPDESFQSVTSRLLVSPVVKTLVFGNARDQVSPLLAEDRCSRGSEVEGEKVLPGSASVIRKSRTRVSQSAAAGSRACVHAPLCVCVCVGGGVCVPASCVRVCVGGGILHSVHTPQQKSSSHNAPREASSAQEELPLLTPIAA